jgi:hypothetical protein
MQLRRPHSAGASRLPGESRDEEMRILAILVLVFGAALAGGTVFSTSISTR